MSRKLYHCVNRQATENKKQVLYTEPVCLHWWNRSRPVERWKNLCVYKADAYIDIMSKMLNMRWTTDLKSLELKTKIMLEVDYCRHGCRVRRCSSELRGTMVKTNRKVNWNVKKKEYGESGDEEDVVRSQNVTKDSPSTARSIEGLMPTKAQRESFILSGTSTAPFTPRKKKNMNFSNSCSCEL